MWPAIISTVSRLYNLNMRSKHDSCIIQWTGLTKITGLTNVMYQRNEANNVTFEAAAIAAHFSVGE